MKPAFYCLLLLLLCPFVLQAQTNYKPGLVVTLEGDTLRGFINYREWSNTPASVTFRADLNNSGTEKVFDPSNALYIEIKGMEAFHRYEGLITMNPVAIDRISYESKTIRESVVVFLRVNYTGEFLDLLSYTDQLKTRFFFWEKDGSQPQELFYNRYYASSNSSQVIVQKGYVGQLQFLATKYDVSSGVINREIEAAQYVDYDLVNVFNKINSIRVSAQEPKDSKSSATRFFAGIALNGSTVKITGLRGLEAPESNPVSVMPRIAIGTDIFLNRHIQQLFLRVEAALTAANYHVQNEIEMDYRNYTFSYRISHQSFSVSPQIIYSLYNKDDFKVYAGVIGQLSYSRYSRNFYTEIARSTVGSPSNPESSYESPNHMSLEKIWFTPAFRSGIVLNKRYELFAFYSPPAAIMLGSYIKVESLYIGMNYMFNK